MYLKEKHGGSRLDCAIIDCILVSEVFKALDWDMFVVGLQHVVEVAEVAGQQHYSKQPPDGADYTSRQAFRVRTSTWEETGSNRVKYPMTRPTVWLENLSCYSWNVIFMMMNTTVIDVCCRHCTVLYCFVIVMTQAIQFSLPKPNHSALLINKTITTKRWKELKHDASRLSKQHSVVYVQLWILIIDSFIHKKQTEQHRLSWSR